MLEKIKAIFAFIPKKQKEVEPALDYVNISGVNSKDEKRIFDVCTISNSLNLESERISLFFSKDYIRAEGGAKRLKHFIKSIDDVNIYYDKMGSSLNLNNLDV